MCFAVCRSVMQCDAVWCSVLQWVAVCCSVLQCVAVCCSVWQCVAVCCRCSGERSGMCIAVCCSVLQRVAVRCSCSGREWKRGLKRSNYHMSCTEAPTPVERAEMISPPCQKLDESCHTFQWAMPCMLLSHVSHMNVSCLKYVTHRDEACLTCECVLSHMCHTHGWVMSMCECVMSHICLTYGWVMSNVWMCDVSHMSHTWMSHVSHVNTSYLAYERVIWLISKLSLVTLKKFTVQSLLQGSFAKETYIYWDPTGGEGCNDIISYLTYERVIWLVWLISQVLSPSNISHTHTHTPLD